MAEKEKISDRFWNFCARPFRKFAVKHPKFYNKHRDLIGSMICGIMGSTITYVFCSFMPYLFGQYFAEIDFAFPSIKMTYKEVHYIWSVIGFGVRIRDGEAIIGGGLGYSISFYLANITTHAVSFLFLRRFHHSTQNAYKQYFIGLAFCLLTCILGNMVNGLWLPIFNARLTFLEYNLIVLFVVGTINFIIGHIQNLILYKDESKLNKRLEKIEEKKRRKQEKKLHKLYGVEPEDLKLAEEINEEAKEELEELEEEPIEALEEDSIKEPADDNSENLNEKKDEDNDIQGED